MSHGTSFNGPERELRVEVLEGVANWAGIGEPVSRNMLQPLIESFKGKYVRITIEEVEPPKSSE
jgi:hypothetical protein